MTRFNKRPSGLIVPATPAPIVSAPSPTLRTGNAAPGFVRDAKGELFLLAVSNFVGQDKFYESAAQSDGRYVALIHAVANEDHQWLGRFLPWLRNEANMRTASIVGAVEAARAMVHVKIPGARAIVNSVLVRADEPGEALGYWLATYPGRQVPKPLKRGIADAATRLYNEFNTLKYDTASHGLRFGDVLELTHASPDKPYQVALFKHLIDRRHGRPMEPDISLEMIFNNSEMRRVAAANPKVLLASESLKAAGMTWEDALSLAGNKVDKAKLWEAMIPNMGYMALLRNLRNFDEAGISYEAAEIVRAKLTDPEEVARSRQLPMRFLSAHRAAGGNLQWAAALDKALNLSLRNIPEFKGRTLILIDTSGSMWDTMSDKSGLKRQDAAAVFGLALAQRCEDATVVSFADSTKVFPGKKGESLLVALDRFSKGFFIGSGTATERAVRMHFANHNRVVILTDEQANYHGYRDVAAAVPSTTPVITFNLAGYKVGHMESGTPTRITIGGLSDQAFKLLPVLEARAAGQWPF